MYHYLPDGFFHAALYATFFVEIILPIGAFGPPELQICLGVLVIALQVTLAVYFLILNFVQ